MAGVATVFVVDGLAAGQTRGRLVLGGLAGVREFGDGLQVGVHCLQIFHVAFAVFAQGIAAQKVDWKTGDVKALHPFFQEGVALRRIDAAVGICLRIKVTGNRRANPVGCQRFRIAPFEFAELFRLHSHFVRRCDPIVEVAEVGAHRGRVRQREVPDG